jgi:hypothetical protein
MKLMFPINCSKICSVVPPKNASYAGTENVLIISQSQIASLVASVTFQTLHFRNNSVLRAVMSRKNIDKPSVEG